MSSPKIRLAYLVSHPIQYQAPLLRKIAAEPGIDLHVYFCSDISVGQFQDVEFRVNFSWDVSLLDGYSHEFLPAWDNTHYVSLTRPLNHGWVRRLKQRKIDALWVHGYARPFHIWAMAVARAMGIKILVRDEATRTSVPRQPWKKLFKKPFMGWLRNTASGFLSIGSKNREYYMDYGIAPERIFDVPYCVDNSFFQQKIQGKTRDREQLRKSLALNSDYPVILFASKMIPRKRAGDLIEAFARLSSDGKIPPPAYLLMIGEGEMRSVWEKQAARFGWPNIRFLGFKNQTELPAYYDLCDIFVLPSVFEPWGLVINEVMNAGRPVVACDQVGSAADLVRHGTNGFVYPAGDINSLTKALKTLIEDDQLRKSMGAASLARINQWSFDDDVKGILQALQATH